VNLTLDLSPEAVASAATTAPAPRITWRKIGECHYEATVDGARYRLYKTGGSWYAHKFNKAHAASNVLARQDMAIPLRSEWEVVRPDSSFLSFGRTLKAAKANAALFLVRGIGSESVLWED
jgi:hypothetical protein